MEFHKLTDQEIWDIANPIMDNLMQASNEIDHDSHVKDFTDRLKNIVTPEHLDRVCKESQREKGTWLNRVPAAIFRRPSSLGVIWKQFCSNVEGEYVAEIVLVYQDNRFLVNHTMVF